MASTGMATLAAICERFESICSRLRFHINSWRFEAYGANCRIERGVRIRGKCVIKIGDNVVIRRNVFIGGNGLLEIGSNTCINEEVIMAVTKKVVIGQDCMIAPRAYILDVDHCYSDPIIPIRSQGYSSLPVYIGNDVWIGANAVITKGTSLGSHSIVGANSVVTKDVTPFAIVGGVPARFIKDRRGV